MASRAEVVFVDGVRTPFGRAGEKGMYWNTRADDLVVKAMIGLLDDPTGANSHPAVWAPFAVVGQSGAVK